MFKPRVVSYIINLLEVSNIGVCKHEWNPLYIVHSYHWILQVTNPDFIDEWASFRQLFDNAPVNAVHCGNRFLQHCFVKFKIWFCVRFYDISKFDPMWKNEKETEEEKNVKRWNQKHT